MSKMTGIIFDIDHFAVNDGKGIRTAIYFKGCPLRCLWCHSPESQSNEIETIHNTENHQTKAKKTIGRYITVSDLINEILPQKVFFDNSGGGVTITGGEPLMQPEFLIKLFEALRNENIHTIIETSMMCDPNIIKSLHSLADVFYCDIKIVNPAKHKEFTGTDNFVIMQNIRALARYRRNKNIVLRVPLIPGYTDSTQDIEKIIRFAKDIGLTDIHLLPYNPTAPAKYEWFNMKYPLGELKRQSDEYLNTLLSLAPADINVIIA